MSLVLGTKKKSDKIQSAGGGLGSRRKDRSSMTGDPRFRSMGYDAQRSALSPVGGADVASIEPMSTVTVNTNSAPQNQNNGGQTPTPPTQVASTQGVGAGALTPQVSSLSTEPVDDVQIGAGPMGAASAGTAGDVTANVTVTVASKQAILRDPDNGFKALKADSLTKVTDKAAWLRNPDDGFSAILNDDKSHAMVPFGAELEVIEEKKTSRGTMGHVRWSGGEGWTSSGNYRTKKGVTLLAPKGTSVTLLSTRTVSGTTYAHIKWADGDGWTAQGNLSITDLTYATRFAEDGSMAGAELTGGKTRRLKFERDAVASKGVISVKESNTLRNSVIGYVKSSKAYKRKAGTFEQLSDLLTKGAQVVILERVEHEGKPYARVMDMSGQESWTWAGNIRGWSSGVTIMAKIDGIKNAKVRAALQEAYGVAVDAVLAGKEYSPAQQGVLQKAKAFVADSGAQSRWPELKVPGYMRTQAGESLNTDLIRRLDIFVRFSQHAGLAAGPPRVMSGIRARTKAHELSIRWMFNPKSKVLPRSKNANRVALAKKLVDMNGVDRATSIRWATAAQVSTMETFLLDEGVCYSDETKEAARMKTVETFHKAVDAMQSTHGTQRAQAAEGYEKGNRLRDPNLRSTGVSLHCGGEAMDVEIPWKFNFYDPVIDAIALIFGLRRPVKDSGLSPEYWHYERLGIPVGMREEGFESPAD